MPRPTAQGALLLIVAALALLAGIPLGRNYLILVGTIALSLAGIGLVLPVWTVRRVRVRRAIPSPLFARRRGEVFLEIESPGQRIGSAVIEVQDHAVETPGAAPDRIARVLFALPRGKRLVVRYPAYVRRRGDVPFTHVRLATESPLGLWRAEREIPLAEVSRVLPTPIRIREIEGAPRSLLSSGVATAAPVPAGAEREFFSLREFREGDDPRRIHWRSSAKRPGPPLVREDIAQQDARLQVVLDGKAAPRLGQRPAFERAISYAASLVRDLARRDRPFGVEIRSDGQPAVFPLVATPAELSEVLGALAVLPPPGGRPGEGAEGPPGLWEGGPPSPGGSLGSPPPSPGGRGDPEASLAAALSRGEGGSGAAPGGEDGSLRGPAILIRSAPLPANADLPADVTVIDTSAPDFANLFEFDADPDPLDVRVEEGVP